MSKDKPKGQLDIFTHEINHLVMFDQNTTKHFKNFFGGCLIKTAASGAAVQEIRNHLHPQFVQLLKMIKRNFISMCTFREGQNRKMAAT